MAEYVVHIGLQPSEYKRLTLGELSAIRAEMTRRQK